MINKLPRWVIAGGAVLAFVAGMINAIGYLGFRHQAVTHMTGTTSLLGIAAGQDNVRDILHFGGLMLSFVLGCAASGLIIGDSTLRLGRRYGVALAIESALLFAAVPLLHLQSDYGLWLAAAACGLQNAMAGTFSGAVVRTSHMSGIVTDLGTLLGQRMRGVAVDARRIRLYLVLFAGFLGGGAAAAFAYSPWQENALLLPATLTGAVGVAYVIYRHRHVRKAHRV
ncbi:MAG: DUF1275 domain-containing protein [Xanthomonadales bacterium PRO7]|nr:DUF1275 domain-containing protein [Xanthomonadales bacterium PRO7]